MLCGVKRSDIVKKKIVCLVVIVQKSDVFGKWSKIYTLDVTKFKFNILSVDRHNVQVFCKNSLFLICTN